jgi:hypothetical protein
MIIGTVGMGVFIYGKKAESMRALVGGIVLCVIPMVVSVVWMEWAAVAACVGAMVVAGKME